MKGIKTIITRVTEKYVEKEIVKHQVVVELWVLFMEGHIIQKWYECSVDDQDHNRYDWVFRSVVENEDLSGWNYWLINDNHDPNYLNRVCILETIAVVKRKIANELWRTKGLERRSVDWGSRMSNATIGIITFGGDIQRELETSGDKSCSLHQVKCKEGLKVSWDGGHRRTYLRY